VAGIGRWPVAVPQFHLAKPRLLRQQLRLSVISQHICANQLNLSIPVPPARGLFSQLLIAQFGCPLLMEKALLPVYVVIKGVAGRGVHSWLSEQQHYAVQSIR